MKFISPRKPTGLCVVCGKPTKLLIHTGCGDKIHSPKKPKNRQYKKEFLSHMSKLGKE